MQAQGKSEKVDPIPGNCWCESTFFLSIRAITTGDRVSESRPPVIGHTATTVTSTTIIITTGTATANQATPPAQAVVRLTNHRRALPPPPLRQPMAAPAPLVSQPPLLTRHPIPPRRPPRVIGAVIDVGDTGWVADSIECPPTTQKAVLVAEVLRITRSLPFFATRRCKRMTSAWRGVVSHFSSCKRSSSGIAIRIQRCHINSRSL